MGVQGLWSILSPVEEHVPLRQLRGHTLAVDLAIWVVEDRKLQEKLSHEQKVRLYMRNLLFRVIRLLHYGVRLVFVLDGPAPALKRKMMNLRRANDSCAPAVNVNRKGFRAVLHHCTEILEALGVVHVEVS